MSTKPGQLLPSKAAVIDLGSNSVKLSSYNVDSENSYKPYHQESVRVKLAEGLRDGEIQETHIIKTIAVLKYFRNIVDFEQIDYVISVATSAVRDASNKDYFVQRIQKETGFTFKILSEHEEAIYSYAGAIRSLSLPCVVFFDIGGGSLEMVSSANFEIKKVVSLPLGSLRLTQQFAGDSETTPKAIQKMRRHVRDLLPDRKSLGLSDTDTPVLVGVGGALRTMTKYRHAQISYPLRKLHNYSLSAADLSSILDDLMPMDTGDLARIDSIGNGRADTIKAGLTVVDELSRRLSFDSVTVSAQGLREGTLALSLQYPDEFADHVIGVDHVQDLMSMSCRPDTMPEHVEDLVRLLFTMGLISERERALLAQAIIQIDKLSSFRDVYNVLYAILDDDSTLSHREQMLVALSLIYTKKKKQAEALLKRFDGILEQSDRKVVKKISAVVYVCDIIHKTKSAAKPGMKPGKLELAVYAPNNTFPEVLFEQACSKMGDMLEISIKPSVYYQTSKHSPSKPIGIS